MILHAARSQPSKLHTITDNILSSIPVSCSLNNKCMNESKLCMCLAVLQRCTTPPSIALNLFLSSCLHCVVCSVHLMGTWSRVHQDECIVAFIICSLSQMKYPRWCNGWKLRIDIVKTFRRWHPEPSSNRAMRRGGDIRPPSAQRQRRAHHHCYNSQIIVSHLQSLISSKQSRQGAGWVSHVDSVMFGRWASRHITWHHVTLVTPRSRLIGFW